jgi:hypothetical protein
MEDAVQPEVVPTDATPPTIALRGRAVDVEMRGPYSDSGIERVGIIFDCNVMADIEERFNEGYVGFVRYDEDDTDGHKQGDKVLDENGKAKRDTFWGLEAWQASMNDRPFYTVRLTMGLALGIPDRDAGQRMIEERLPDYFTAVGAAFAIANGVDPTTAFDAAREGMEKMREELARQAADAAAAREAREAKPMLATPGQPG